jgi:hypothetical protein
LGFQAFNEFLNYAQDKTVVRIEADAERGQIVFLGAEFYPPAPPPQPVMETPQEEEFEDDGPQPYVEGQPSIFEPNPPPAKPKKTATRKRSTSTKSSSTGSRSTTSRPRKRKTD